MTVELSLEEIAALLFLVRRSTPEMHKELQLAESQLQGGLTGHDRALRERFVSLRTSRLAAIGDVHMRLLKALADNLLDTAADRVARGEAILPEDVEREPALMAAIGEAREAIAAAGITIDAAAIRAEDDDGCSWVEGHGPGKGTPCGLPVAETLHGVSLCRVHANEARRVNGLPPLPEPVSEPGQDS